MITYLTRYKTVKPQRQSANMFIYDLGIYAFRKYMSAKIPGMVQGCYILAYSLIAKPSLTDN